MGLFVSHLPHLALVLAASVVMLRFWRRERQTQREYEATLNAGAEPRTEAPLPASAAPAESAAPVGRVVAIRGLIALGPLIGAFATGLVIYAVNLGARHASDAAIWAHVGLSLLALLLVLYKIADIGLAGIRARLKGAGAWLAGGAVVLLALWVPLLVSGVALLVSPSEASFTAYAHLIASVWWTGLLLWHLRRYLIRAIVTLMGPPAVAGDREESEAAVHDTPRTRSPRTPRPRVRS